MLYPLIHTLFDKVPSNPQILTFVHGQVVKGEVQKILPDQQAVIRFGQHVIRASADIPLEVGRTAWFQVLSTDNPITLKFLAEPEQRQVSSQGFGPLLSHLKLKDGAVERSVLQFFVREGLPITKDHVHQAVQILRELGVQPGNLEGIKVALHRGIPLTTETVHALREFLFGAPLGQRLQQLNRLLPSSWQVPIPKLEIQPQVVSNASNPVNLQVSLNQNVSSQQGGSSPAGVIQVNTGGQGNDSIPAQAQATQQADVNRTSFLRSTDPSAEEQIVAQRLASQPGATAAVHASRSTELHVVQQAGANMSPVTLTFTTQLAFSDQAGSAETLKGVQLNATAASSSTTVEGGTSTRTESDGAPIQQRQNSPIHRFLEWLGVGHEKDTKMFVQSASHGDEHAPIEVSLKSRLQELLKHPELTSAAKEQVQSALHYITGQQLLIQDNTTHHMHLLLFQLPMQWFNQEQVVYGQIQGFKKNGKQIDPSNCRMLFYLQLQSLGELCVDLQIQNHTVSVVCYNDRISAEKGNEWLSSSYESLQAALAESGFHLTSLKWKESVSSRQESQAAKQYPLYYEGVDVRI